MHTRGCEKTGKIFLPVCALLLLLPVLFFLLLYGAENWGRQLSALAVRRHFAGWQERETDYFKIRYPAAEAEAVSWLAPVADEAARQVKKYLPFEGGKPWLAIAGSQSAIQKVFGWGEGMGVLGVYKAETIVLLSPSAWQGKDGQEKLAAFYAANPLVHEYTHYVLEKRAGGGYPRWFSEGLASLLQYFATGFEWVEEGSTLRHGNYSIAELERDFDLLPDQALAYRQALSKVCYLFELQGMEGINRLIDYLAAGIPFWRTMEKVYGTGRKAFYFHWQQWYPESMFW
ncbi:MAG TPA: hypothetical protein GXZ53_05070 [Firmicutes bacterium]|nr:hypothetical protein [Bacillota bacterium]